jgi:hypothetical protein
MTTTPSSFNIDKTDKENDYICIQSFSWTPVILGALTALGLGFLLDLFGKGIGLTLYTTDINGATALAIGGFLGMIIGSIAAMFTAGFIAGFFAAPTCSKKNYGIVYGFAAWCLSLLLIAGFSSAMSNMGHTLSGEMITSTKEIGATTQNVTSRLHPATDLGDTAAEKKVRAVGIITFSMFVLFFIGAFSACIGGYCGFQCLHNRDVKK